MWHWRLRWKRARFEWGSLQEEEMLRNISTGTLKREVKNLQVFVDDGRICLIKFVLSSIPLFFMSLFKLPTGVADKLVRIQRNFLCGWGAEGKNIAWASWKMVCKPRELGGLGVIDLKLFNLALLGK